MSEIMEVVVDLETFDQQAKEFWKEEQARRERALAFAEKVKEILLPVANVVFRGENDSDFVKKTQSLGQTKTYFRWESINIGCVDETPGFYCKHVGCGNSFGEPLEKIAGNKFWGMIRAIVDWIPEVTALLNAKDESRERLVALLKV